MTEKSNGVPKHDIRPRTVILAISVIGIVIVAGLGIWYLLIDSSGECEVAPTCELLQNDESQWTFTINYTARYPVTWDDIWIKLEATPTDPGASYSYAYWDWQPTRENLTSEDGQPITQSINAYNSLKWMFFCNVTDISGNGVMSDGDYFSLALVGDEFVLTDVPCRIMFLYEPMGDPMCVLEFVP
jgi:hypothetical protein